MGVDDNSLLGVVKTRLGWLAQRSQVLAENIANSDTPGFRPRDLEPFRFKDAVKRHERALALAATDSGHLENSKPASGPFRVVTQRDPYEATPTGNAVVLEEQAAKVSDTVLAHRVATQLYRKYLGMMRMVASSRG